MALHLTEEEYAELRRRYQGRAREAPPAVAAPPAARTKYGNWHTVIDGKRFDSKKEAEYYFGTLVPRWRAGELKLLCRQVPFDLPGGIKYIADFVAVTRSGEVEIIDVKSEATRRNRVYVNKRKQMQALWGLEIKEV